MNFLDKFWQLNVITPTQPKITLDSLQVGIKGLFFDQRIGDYDTVRFPSMPYKNNTHLDTLQTFISMQSIDSFFESYLDVHEGPGWYNETQLPPPLDFTLTTQDLNIMLPGMVNTYGKNKQVKLEYKVEDFGDFRSRFAKPYMIATATVNLRFWVVNAPDQEELAVELNLYNITNKVFLNEKPDLKMSLMIGEFRLHGVEIVDSRIGMLNPNTIRLKLNTVNSVIVTLSNIILQKWEVQIPNMMLGNLFHLTNLHLEYFDGYIYAGVTPMYVQPLKRPKPSVPNTQDHSLPMNGAFEEENQLYSGHYRHHGDSRYRHHYYDDNVVQEDMLYTYGGHAPGHEFYDYGPRYYHDNHYSNEAPDDRGV